MTPRSGLLTSARLDAALLAAQPRRMGTAIAGLLPMPRGRVCAPREDEGRLPTPTPPNAGPLPSPPAAKPPVHKYLTNFVERIDFRALTR